MWGHAEHVCGVIDDLNGRGERERIPIRFKSSPNRAGPQSTKCHPNGPRGYIPCRFTDGFDRSEDCNVSILWSGPSAIICDDKFALVFEVKLENA